MPRDIKEPAECQAMVKLRAAAKTGAIAGAARGERSVTFSLKGSDFIAETIAQTPASFNTNAVDVDCLPVAKTTPSFVGARDTFRRIQLARVEVKDAASELPTGDLPRPTETSSERLLDTCPGGPEQTWLPKARCTFDAEGCNV